MDSTKQATSELRQRMIEDMRMRKFADKTQSHYLRAVRQFSRYLGRKPDTATAEELRQYQLHLVDQGISPVSLNAAISGLRFFFEVTLGCGELMAKMQPVHVPHKLPVILSREEVARLIASAGNLKYQAALSVALRQERRADVGAKKAVERFLGRRMQKSKRTSTTNWSKPFLTERQMLYAANDAQVALRVYRAWQKGKASSGSQVAIPDK